MKRFSSTLLAWMWIVASCLGATVNTSMLDQQDFTTNGVPPASVGVRLKNTQFSHTASGITITDVTGVTGAGGAAIPGTIVTNSTPISPGDLFAAGTASTNAAKATSADVQAALGQVYQATNSALTTLAGGNGTGLSSLSAAAVTAVQTNIASANPSATIGNSAVNGSATTFMRSDAAPALPTTLQHYNGTDTNAILSAIGGVAKAGDTMTGDLFVPHLALTNGASHANLYPDAANTLALRNGANAQAFNIYNTYANSGTDYERGYARWSGNVYELGVEVGGTGTARHSRIKNVGGSIYFYTASADRWLIDGSGNFLANSDNVVDFGGNGTGRPRNVTAGTSINAPTISGGPAVASPGNTTVVGINGSGTDKSGGSLTLEGGQSTGTGRGGGVVMRTSRTITTGSTANSYDDRARYVPKYIDLTDNTATTLFTVALPATNSIGIQFVCTVIASDGTDFQSLTTPVTVDAVAKTTTITTVVAPTAAQTALAGSGGTLSVTYTVVDAGSNVLAVKATADTSFGSPIYLRAKIVMTAINGMGAGWSITEI